MTRRQISLAHLTVLDTTPPELVAAAAAAGFRTIGIRLTATPSVGVPPYDILHEGPLLRETLRRLADTGVSVLDTEFLRFEPEQPVGIPEGFLEVSARLGARNVLVMSAEPDEARTIERFCELWDASSDMPGPGDTPALIREARTGRLLPGEGALPLRDLVAALPATAPLAVEAPCRALADLSPVERAKRAYQALSALLT